MRNRSYLRVIDVSAPSAPFEVGFYDTPGWAEDVAVSRGYVFVTDGEAGMAVFRDYASLFFDGFESGDASAWSSFVVGSP